MRTEAAAVCVCVCVLRTLCGFMIDYVNQSLHGKLAEHARYKFVATDGQKTRHRPAHVGLSYIVVKIEQLGLITAICYRKRERERGEKGVLCAELDRFGWDGCGGGGGGEGTVLGVAAGVMVARSAVARSQPVG